MATDASSTIGRLDRRLSDALAHHGVHTLTEIQELALPLLHSSADALLISPTGTGKTEAALLPLLSRQLKDPSPPTSLLYVTPLRALNRDLEHRLVSLVKEVHLTAAVRHGDTAPAERLRQSRRPPDLLLTTPETLQLLLVGKRLREGLRNVRAVVVDEVHELAPSDRGAQLMITLERLDAFVGRPVRRIGLSATVGNPDEVARYLSPAPRSVEVRVARQPRIISIAAQLPPPDRPALDPTLVAELRADPVLLEALRTVEAEVRRHRTTLIFVNTRPTAEGLAARLRRLAPDLPSAVHHGSLSREMREEAERSFRAGELRALVATSSLELGIDIGMVDLVIQFGSPHQASRLLQRVGRSGHRLDREVHGIVVALDEEDLEEATVLARRAVAGDLEPIQWRDRHRLAVAQQILAELRAEGSIDVQELATRFRHAAPAAGLDDREWAALVNYLEGLGSLRREGARIQSGRGTLHRFYATLSLIPDERTFKLRDIATRRLIGTLDERFVLTQIMAEPDLIFLLHGRTWKVVEFREGELLVEAVAEIGQEPRWVGEDLPVPFEVAQEIGRRRREGGLAGYPVDPASGARLEKRWAEARAGGPMATDQVVTVTGHGRIAVFGACFGTRTNSTLALAAAGLLTARLGARVEVLAVEPTSFVLGLPVAVDPGTLEQAVAIAPDTLEGLLEKLVPSGLEYRWVFLTVARKLGVLPPSVDPRDLRLLEPLLEQARETPLGEEALEKTLHDRYDLPHAREVLGRIGRGEISVVRAAPGPLSDSPLARLRWRELPDVPPPTLLKAVAERLNAEELTLVCLRCGFMRNTSPARYRADGGSTCRLCHGALSAVLSPRRVDEVAAVQKYAKRKWKGAGPPRRVPPSLPPLVRAAYTSAELLAHHGERALLCLAARGVGPETARRLLARLYRSDSELLTEILKAERSYARTRSFWD
ncbi:MAG TPA: DEAD/DEAH box helicase [Thermoplasmata archaeon]|nr:DEAD/DEAH box helicase [Thermoplasmata archaeon]